MAGSGSGGSSGGGGANAIGALGLGLQALGAIQGAFGAYYQGRIMRSQLKLQAAISEINAKVAENAAQMALLRGQRAEGISRLKTAQLKSDQKVALAANGVDLTGSPSVDNILGTTDFMGELDALTINQNAVADANNFRTQSANYGAQATMSAAQASGVNAGAMAFNSLLGSAGQFAQSAYQYKKNS